MSEMNARVEPRTLKGFQDFLPADIIARKHVMQTIEQVFASFGFQPVETPALEYLDTLLGAGGEGSNKEMFRLESPEGDPIAMRFDLTVPFARLLAQYPERLKVPFRRYAVGRVWRADKPGPGRFREFTQFDIDAAGTTDLAVDAEIIAVMATVMRTLGVPSYAVLVNNRELIDALLSGCGVCEEARQKHVLRVIDKLAKVGLDNVRLELGPGRIDESGDPIPGVQLAPEVSERILAFVGITGATRAAIVDRMAEIIPPSEAAATAIEGMRELDACLTALELPDHIVQFSPSLARGLDYYTGPVFETVLPDAPEFGSVMGGGRYNRLVERFLDRAIPCTGMSVGLDRLMAALRHLGLVPETQTNTQVLIATIGKGLRREALRLAAELRAGGLRVEVYFAAGAKAGLKVQLAHADHYGIPVAVILGEDEVANGVVAVKDLMAGKLARTHIEDHDAYRAAGKTGQQVVPRTEAVSTITSVLAQYA